MNKKVGKMIACASALATVVAASGLLFACKPNETDKKLATPVISIDGSVVSWSAVEHATSYDVTVGEYTTDTTDTSYTISVTEEGTYTVSVVAKSTETGWLTSDKSNELTYTYAKPTLNARLQLDAQPTKSVYYLDEKSEDIDLAGISVKAVYSDSSTKTLAVADLSLKGEVDLTTVGSKKVELQYTADGVTALCDFRIEVKQRTAADLDRDGIEYAEAQSEFGSADKYKISGAQLTTVTDMTGEAVAVTTDADGTYVAASAFTKSGAMLVNADGDFINIVAAIYIRTADDFKAINENLDGYFVLQNDISFGATELGSNGNLAEVWGNGVTTSVVGTAPLRKDTTEDGAVYELDFSGSEDLEVAGVPFTGTFDGKGYKITNALVYFPEGADDPDDRVPAYDKRAQTLSLFGYIGSSATVGNFTLSSSIIRSGKNSGLIASANLGTIKNVVVDDDCVLAVRYQNSATIAAYNGGTIENCVSYATNISGAEEGAAERISAVKATGAVEKNVYLGDTSDKTEALGAGWFYIEGYGTVYGNNEYNKLVSYNSTWYVGQDVTIKVYSVAGAEEFTATTWGIPGHNVDNPAFTVAKSGNSGMIELTLTWAQTVNSTDLPAGTKFVFAVGNEVSGNFGTVAITVGEPYTVSVESIEDGITCAKGKSINLGAVNMVVNLSDGTTKTVHPTKTEGEFDNSTEGDKTVTFVYEENGNEFKKTATVNVFIPAAAISASLKTGVDKVIIGYDNGWSLDNVTWTDFFDITDGDNDVSGYNVSVAGDIYGEGITFTISKAGYSSDTVTVDAYLGVDSKEAFNAINSNLSGWYILTDNIDFENDATPIGQMPLIQNDDGTSFGWAGSFREGIPFVGVFDGNGKTLSNFTFAEYESGFNAATFGFGVFGYIGEGGKVRNFTISNSAMNASQYTSFVAGINCGEISNVTIAADCSIRAQYGVVAAFSAINYGTIKDSACYIATDVNGTALAASNADLSSANRTETNLTIQAGAPSDSL